MSIVLLMYRNNFLNVSESFALLKDVVFFPYALKKQKKEQHIRFIVNDFAFRHRSNINDIEK